MNTAQLKGFRQLNETMATIDKTECGFVVRADGKMIGVTHTYAGARELLLLHFEMAYKQVE